MGRKQGLENVIDAARLAQRRKSNVKFVLLGDGNQRRSLEEKAKGIRTIQFIDPLPDDKFQHALAAANILLVNELPGVKDMAVPSKLTSYFNAGLPVIAATDAESVTASEIRSSGGGLRVDASDPESLLETAEELGGNATMASDLGAQGLRFRHETLSETAAIGHYDDFITSLAMARDR
jgi:colanic acid biosynthesis glycosyl transferase WcaI